MFFPKGFLVFLRFSRFPKVLFSLKEQNRLLGVCFLARWFLYVSLSVFKHFTLYRCLISGFTRFPRDVVLCFSRLLFGLSSTGVALRLKKNLRV